MSPERIKGLPAQSEDRYLFSLGWCSSTCSPGVCLSGPKNPAQLIYKIINTEPPQKIVSQINSELPEQLDGVIRRSSKICDALRAADFCQGPVRGPLQDPRRQADCPRNARFAVLRKMPFFVEFEDVGDLGNPRDPTLAQRWRPTLSWFYREGDADQRFSVVVDGRVEVSVDWPPGL